MPGPQAAVDCARTERKTGCGAGALRGGAGAGASPQLSQEGAPIAMEPPHQVQHCVVIAFCSMEIPPDCPAKMTALCLFAKGKIHILYWQHPEALDIVPALFLEAHHARWQYPA